MIANATIAYRAVITCMLSQAAGVVIDEHKRKTSFLDCVRKSQQSKFIIPLFFHPAKIDLRRSASLHLSCTFRKVGPSWDAKTTPVQMQAHKIAASFGCRRPYAITSIKPQILYEN